MAADVTTESVAEPGEEVPERAALQATVVEYQNAPDRCTVAPAAVSDTERYTAWLSVDLDAVVSLADWR